MKERLGYKNNKCIFFLQYENFQKKNEINCQAVRTSMKFQNPAKSKKKINGQVNCLTGVFNRQENFN